MRVAKGCLVAMDLPLIIYKSKRKSVIIIIAGALIGVAGTVFLFRTADKGLGWVVLIASVMLLTLGVGSLLDRKPQIIITRRGITEMFTIREEIEWSAILHVDDFFYRGQNFVRLLLPANYRGEAIRPTWFWRFDRMYAQHGMKAVYIRVSGLDINSMQLVALIGKMVNSNTAEEAE